jgi:hypothetical protein
MPTGYTAAVADGTITEFPDFAMQCARAFGTLVLMRDEPQDAAIPEKFEPAGRDKGAMLFHESKFALICAALVAHIQGVQMRRAA